MLTKHCWICIRDGDFFHIVHGDWTLDDLTRKVQVVRTELQFPVEFTLKAVGWFQNPLTIALLFWGDQQGKAMCEYLLKGALTEDNCQDTFSELLQRATRLRDSKFDKFNIREGWHRLSRLLH